MTINLIVPPIAETICAGFELGAHRIIRGHVWRAEFYKSGEIRLYRDDVRDNRAHSELPLYALRLIESLVSYVQSARELPRHG